MLGFGKSSYTDLSYDLQDEHDWKPTIVKRVKCLADMKAIALEPVTGLLAVASSKGTINLFGSHAVEMVLELPQPTAVKIVQFATLVFKLVCVDERGSLYVWDLNAEKKPKLEKSQSFKDPIQCILLSPCHSHAFLALQSGAIVTYDLLCLRISPYSIPNVSKQYEEKMIPAAKRNFESSYLMDLIHHPRELNLVFLAYEDIIVLYDLMDRVAVRHYVLHPSAPGATGHNSPNTHQSSPVTSMTCHPSGHIFAVGHADGRIAFWSVEDENTPLHVRALDDSNDAIREPIFKMSWSALDTADSYGGSTVLTVLGGFRSRDNALGLSTLLFPVLKAPTSTSSPAASSSSTTSPSIGTGEHHPSSELRQVLLASLKEIQVYIYSTSGPVHDFFVAPKEGQPHFCGTAEPRCIFLFSESEGSGEARSFEAMEFPPPEFTTALKSAQATKLSMQMTEVADKEDGANVATDGLTNELASTLEEMQMIRSPEKLPLPPTLWIGTDGIVDGDLVHVDKSAYDRLTSPRSAIHSPLRGGIAWLDVNDDKLNDIKLAKYQPHRLIVTHHRDLSVRFQDTSVQLLLPSNSVSDPELLGSLGTPYPAPLDEITIDFTQLFSEPLIMNHRRPLQFNDDIVQRVQLTEESAECVVTFRSGHVVTYRLADEDYRENSMIKHVGDEEIVDLGQMHSEREGGFKPVLLVDDMWGPVAACELSNVGFLAIGYMNGVLLVLDLRGPKVIFREGTGMEGGKQAKRRSLSGHSQEGSSKNGILSLTWVCCGVNDDPSPSIRLLASYHSGTTKVYTLVKCADTKTWTINPSIEKLDGVEQPLPHASFVVNAKTGASCVATSASLTESEPLSPTSGQQAKERTARHIDPHCFWVSVGKKGARSFLNLNGHRVGKVDWGKGRNVESAEVVFRNGSCALVAITAERDVLVYSLPALNFIRTFHLLFTPFSAMSLDDTGDYVDWTFDEAMGTVSKYTLGTMFDIHRPHTDVDVDLAAAKLSIPSPPKSIPLGSSSSWFGSLFSFQRSITGDQIDALLAGPDRPLPVKPSIPEGGLSDWQKRQANMAQNLAQQGSRLGADLYNSLTSAAAERGEFLNDLDQRFRALGEGSGNMLSQAKRMAAEQTSKGWFGFSS